MPEGHALLAEHAVFMRRHADDTLEGSLAVTVATVRTRQRTSASHSLGSLTIGDNDGSGDRTLGAHHVARVFLELVHHERTLGGDTMPGHEAQNGRQTPRVIPGQRFSMHAGRLVRNPDNMQRHLEIVQPMTRAGLPLL